MKARLDLNHESKYILLTATCDAHSKWSINIKLLILPYEDTEVGGDSQVMQQKKSEEKYEQYLFAGLSVPFSSAAIPSQIMYL